MAGLLLGIDTGGTYTDAVILASGVQGPEALLASAKSLTTHHDLSIGLAQSVEAVLASNPGPAKSGHAPGKIELCAISTTLATNAIVEGLGARVCLVAIGFSQSDLANAGLAEALKRADGLPDQQVIIAGGHGAQGEALCELDVASLRSAIKSLDSDIAGVAVVARFAVRNPAHELQAKELINELCDLPVTCSHELTSKLNGPKRALTCLLNARLIGLIGGLFVATARILAEQGISAPCMVVRGDGSLVSIAFASKRPIETILSGPAASLIGASFLADSPDAFVADIGGTTTDVARLERGRPRLDGAGALVGGHRTMIEAVAISTHGLGGDSEVHLNPELKLGPRRVVPIAVLALEHPEMVQSVLKQQRLRTLPRELDGAFAQLVRPIDEPTLAKHSGTLSGAILQELSEGPRDLVSLLPTRRHETALATLITAGLVIKAAITPTDACVALGLLTQADAALEHQSVSPSGQALGLAARQKERRGDPIAKNGEALAKEIFEAVVDCSAAAVLQAALAETDFGVSDAYDNPLIQAGLAHSRGVVAVDVALDVPLLGVGAAAATYYPGVADKLNARAVIPPWSEVANAVGAVVGKIRMSETALVTPLKRGKFRAHFDQTDFDSAEAAISHTISGLEERAKALATAEGALQVEVETKRHDTTADIGGIELLVESAITVVASGRPGFG